MKSSRIEGQRLDVVLQRLRENNEPSTIADIADFEPLIKERTHRPVTEGSAESLITDFIMPIITSPEIFQDNNAIMLLEYLRDDVLPFLSENEELTSLALKVIDDEIARHDFVRERRHIGIAT